MKSINLKSWLLAETCAIVLETRLHYTSGGFGSFNNAANYYCHFKQTDKYKNLEAYDDCFEYSVWGNGNTPEEAIKDLVNTFNSHREKGFVFGYNYCDRQERFTPCRINKEGI